MRGVALELFDDCAVREEFVVFTKAAEFTDIGVDTTYAEKVLSTKLLKKGGIESDIP